MSNMSRSWLITGCSTGLGRAPAKVLLSHGERVIKFIFFHLEDYQNET